MKCALTLDWNASAEAIPVMDFLAGSPSGKKENIVVNLNGAIGRHYNTFSGLFPVLDRIKSARLDLVQTGIGITCEMHAFSYSFLKGAKNIQLVLPMCSSKESDEKFNRSASEFNEKLVCLDRFEKLGKSMPETLSKNDYLIAREYVSPPSARDERRFCAELMMGGPSDQCKVADGLAIHSGLAQRIVDSGQESGILSIGQYGVGIRAEVQPMIYFLLRETMGLDPLASL